MMGHHGGHHSLHRAASFADFGQHMNGAYNIHQHQQQPYSHRHSLSSSGAHEYHGHPSQAPMHHHNHHNPHDQAAAYHHHQQQQHQQQQQHPGVHMLQRTSSMPQHSYYVTEQNNPGVATMNTNPHAATSAPMHPQYHHPQQMPRQNGERLPLEMPSFSAAAGLTGSIQSSPSTFSTASGRSPSTQDGFYTHAPTSAQAATYALHAASPVEQQNPQIVSFQRQMAAPPQVMTQQAPPSQQPQPVTYNKERQLGIGWLISRREST